MRSVKSLLSLFFFINFIFFSVAVNTDSEKTRNKKLETKGKRCRFRGKRKTGKEK